MTTVCLLPPADPSAGSGCVVAAGAHDGIVRTWDVSVDTRKGKAKVEGVHRMFVGHEGAVTCVAAGPGGDHFASCGHDKTVRVWNRGGGFIDDGSHSNGSKDKKLKKSSKRRKGEDDGESLFYFHTGNVTDGTTFCSTFIYRGRRGRSAVLDARRRTARTARAFQAVGG